MVLVALCGLMVWAAVPALVGWQPTVVMGGSMEPRIHCWHGPRRPNPRLVAKTVRPLGAKPMQREHWSRTPSPVPRKQMRPKGRADVPRADPLMGRWAIEAAERNLRGCQRA